ncbi:MAG TPA: GNAT family N-acetyltransferase [Gaiellaceae bacterium]|nr:GNAT family N-acetyltransferase [Gaiellaceae bacterium]
MLQIETDRLVLRTPRVEDAPGLVLLYSDPEAMRFIGGVHDGPLDLEFVVNRWLDRWERNGGFGTLVAVRRDDGALLGRIGLNVWDTSNWTITSTSEAGEHAQPELGWALARTYWGNGYATEGARAVRDWARNDLGIGRLISVIAPENIASRRVAEKLGCVPGETVELSDTGAAVVWEHP